MEKLGEEDILYEIQEAAEQLQEKIDKKSCLLMDSESWEIGNRPRVTGEAHDFMNMDEHGPPKFLYKSMSDAVLDLKSRENLDNIISAEFLPSFVAANDNPLANKKISLPAHVSFKADAVIIEEELKVSKASSRCGYAVEELGEVAKFKDPLKQQALDEFM